MNPWDEQPNASVVQEVNAEVHRDCRAEIERLEGERNA